MTQAAIPPNVPRLMAKLVENSLDADEAESLRELLAGNTETQSYYCWYLDLHEELGQRFELAIPEPCHPTHDTVHRPPSVSVPLPLSWRAQIFSFLAIATVFYGIFAALAWDLRSSATPVRSSFVSLPARPSLPLPSPLAPNFIARLVSCDNCRWKNSERPPADNDHLGPGLLQLVSGLAEFEFKSGAHVLVKGPCDLELQTTQRSYLQSGMLIARVPHAAVGFTIQTPQASIVDFGTEFAVDVQEGPTEVHVFEGRVEVQCTDSAKGISPLPLTAGMKATLSASGKRPFVEHSITETDLQRFEWAKSAMPGIARQIKSKKSPSAWKPIALQNATATYSQEYGGGIEATIDGDFSNANGWAVGGSIKTHAQTAVYETFADVLVNGYKFTLSFNGFDRHTLGRFRISVTTDPRENFADHQSQDGDVEANWIELTPIMAVATHGTVLTIDKDNSILASGEDPNKSVYTITAASPLLKVTGFRLEALTDPSLPTDGPGRDPNGNFVLTEFQVEGALVNQPKPPP